MKPEFNAAQSPLEKGFTVIEASAGTGKTTTISAIVLRLLAEQGIPIEQILVTTYTELATAELRGRIRETITDALAQTRLPFVAEIVKRVTDRKQFELRLKLALQSFDEASIFTIHSFCARVLADRAFESGVPFETELVADQSRFLHEVVDDFWRANFYNDDTIVAGVLRERFPVALVDEFQDTDPVQYSIFSQIFRGSDAFVFFIGDPKQAIYGFRGADVFTYLEAAKVANRRHTLGQNWRSEAKLVNGVSAIFSRRTDSFVIESIELSPVTASGKADAEALTIGDQRDQPLHFWIAASGDKARMGKVVAAEIASLLTSETKIGTRKIEPRDIAVLVNNNTQPVGVQRALADYRIPSVVYSAASVLKSGEALVLLRVLLAVAKPTNEQIVRAALATEIFGLNASALENLLGDEFAWEATLNRFADYHMWWRDQGFVQMMRELLVREKVRSRLLHWRDGERRLTNILHLIELLHAACVENRFGIDGLIKWLARQISLGGELKDEHELRLESDEDAVRIVTIHKSKGLEYGVTFSPFARKEPWSGAKEFLKFHEDDQLVLDLEESAEHKKIRNREELAESVRQLYVGLTRAKHRSYLIWQERKTKSKSALAWLFSEEASADAFLEKEGVSNTS